MSRPVFSTKITSLETPINRPAYSDFIPSAMKGIVLTSTGESLATPSQAELVKLFNCSPKVGLNFAKIFDFETGDHNGIPAGKHRDDEDEAAESQPPSPSSRKSKEKERRKEIDEATESSSSTTSNSCGSSTTTTSQVNAVPPAPPPPTRIRRPSIRNSTRPTHIRAGTLPTSTSDPLFPTTVSSSSAAQPKPLPHPHLRPSKSNSNLGSFSQGHHRAPPPPEYDFTDEENLPSPFLKKNDKHSQAKAAGAAAVGPMMNFTAANAPSPSTATSTTTSTSTTASRGKRRPSTGLLLRAVAAANNVERRGTLSSTSTTASPVLDNGSPYSGSSSGMESMSVVDAAGMMDNNHDGGGIPRPSLASARKASEEARKALLRV